MSDADHWSPRISSLDNDFPEEYRALCVSAALSLVMGLASVTFLFHPMFAPFPLAGLACSIFALRRIARESPAPTGRPLAIAGLCLTIMFLVAAPVQKAAYNRLLRKEAHEFSLAWFDLMRQGQPHMAFEMTREPKRRATMDHTLWEAYRTGRAAMSELESYLAEPASRALLSLGDQADVRYYDTTASGVDSAGTYATQIYAVTYQQDGRKKSFFVGLALARVHVASTHQANWQIQAITPAARPEDWPGE